jgi:hypothetical protein
LYDFPPVSGNEAIAELQAGGDMITNLFRNHTGG